ncbi:hypothetical protein [Shewanella sp. Iso12]|uniref:hypothetical protein n=1 Tax=Shewanella sp. Iso12 TaxID=1826753 RepID=UPI0014317EBA|nr:hypothetical protein [Shewanella sp. Iso12]NJI84796.1 hypothetical protein [Shewanella sp. Iso12]
MFQTIKDNFAMVSIALLTIAVIVSGAMWAVTAGQLSTANTNLTNETAAKFVLQTDLDNATEQIKAAELEKQVAISDAKALAAALIEREQNRRQLEQAYTELKTQVSQLLENSNDEHTRSWAADHVPSDLARLLEHAADCANGDGNKAGACTSTGRTAGVLRNPISTENRRPESQKSGAA